MGGLSLESILLAPVPTMKLVLILPFVVACAASTQSQQVLDKEGALFWEFESKEGVPDGESRTYYPDGEVRTIGYFRNAEFHGRFVRYEPDGQIAYKAYFWHDVLVWKSESESAEPPIELLTELLSVHNRAEVRDRFGNTQRRISASDSLNFRDRRSPSPRFVYADWRVSDRPVLGARLSVGGATAENTAVVSKTFFGQVPIGSYAASASFSQAQLHAYGDSESGRSLLELGGNRRWDTPKGKFVARTSLSFPVAGEDAKNALITASTVAQSPKMAATSVGSTAAFRAGGSWLWHQEKWGVQADLGADRTFGGDQAPSLTFIHTSLAAAYGVRSVYGTLELSSVMRLGADEGAITSAGIGGAVRALGVETKLLVGSSMDSEVTATLGAEYEF